MPSTSRTSEYDVLIVGAGISGLYALYKMRAIGLSARVLELGDGVGGTWFWNRYPGARCDIESLQYSYSFDPELEQEWVWSERYPTQPEILRYLNHVADRHDLRRDIQLDTRVVSEVYDETSGRWQVETEAGDRFVARYVVMATGTLSVRQVPRFKGLDTFHGAWYHTGNWPTEGVDLTGLRVGFVGTGSTGIQAIPTIARQAAHITVFQRTPNFTLPARNHIHDPNAIEKWKRQHYREAREEAYKSLFGILAEEPTKSALEVSPEDREVRFESAWQQGGGPPMLCAYTDLLTDEKANETAAEFVREKIREIVKDPAVAELLAPTDHPIGTKRICIDTGYYKTYNRDNVTLVDARKAPIEEITPKGLRTTEHEYEFDVLVFATGFDAITGALSSIDIRGRDGVALTEKWADGPRTFLGLATAGFPNLFTVHGPLSPSPVVNMVLAAEQHIDWIAACITWAEDNDHDTVEANRDAEDAWVEHVQEVADATLFPRANSWYFGANTDGKPRLAYLYFGGLVPYTAKLNEVRESGYEGFTFAAVQQQPTAA